MAVLLELQSSREVAAGAHRDMPGSSSGKRRAAVALEGSDGGGKRRKGGASPDENAQPANGAPQQQQQQQRVFGKPAGVLSIPHLLVWKKHQSAHARTQPLVSQCRGVAALSPLPPADIWYLLGRCALQVPRQPPGIRRAT